MEKAVKGSWVEIENQVLSVDERAPQVPEDTKETPLMMWTRGFLIEESAAIGEDVSVYTLSGRSVRGKLVEINPRFEHDFGNPVLELLETGVSLREDLENL
ncbi:2-amino-4-oxopentanoate thiolase subunit OrtA [Geosporobacter ferrireducens]|uniref:2-amino-4-ketopentanoate thiolase n=1 Tax=Geosporobacter ferrireducens TaxID=1424294 RepID=A0A1D8GKU8_9FIRM|nr:2-amino-4-oxopentanoate thiolase subunit OrtA [Geosporobacter ferrireducens]AOT71538.1 2-amino-4-ketopentanoate thiolase [Geosporobacter ferrireducens]MTI57852.1 2-amino-4-ketopentanoate thiolase [Geosporobacter ferrireducens]